MKHKYEDNVEFKQIPHKSPEAIFYNIGSLVVERVDLSKLNRQQCNDLLIEKGFKEKLTGSDDQTPSADL